MMRLLGLTFLAAALSVAYVTAQDDLPAKEREKKEPAAPQANENVQKIIERLNKNMDSSEERLGKKDPGDDTRKIQDDIIKDLDELINQKNKGGGGGGGGGGGAASSSGGGGGGGGATSTTKRTSRSRSGGQSKNKNQSAKNDLQKSDKDKGGGDKLGKDNDQTAKNDPGKDGKGGSGLGSDSKNTKDKNTLGDLFKDVWGHLPLSKRQEMDAYAKERFLAKYDEILRQYYRTISEQGRRKD